jgi:GNAT superfamily N-acetyltransferase
MTDPADLRPAVPADAAALASLERAANLLGLAHVFPADEHQYPMAEVEDRWRRVLGDPDVAVDVAEDRLGLLAFVAYDEEVLRHLGVRPDAWGGGLGRAMVEHAASRMGPAPRLWCLVDNTRARSLYERLGWRATGRTQPAEWPPYPVEMEYVLGG